MIRQLDIVIPTRPIKQVKTEIDGDADLGWPDSIRGRLLDVPPEDLLPFFQRHAELTMGIRQDINVIFAGKGYKFARLEKDGFRSHQRLERSMTHDFNKNTRAA